MPNVCDPTKFPAAKYFQQYELAEFGPPGYTYDYTRCFLTRMEATLVGTKVDTLTTIMDEYEFNSGRPYPGKPRVVPGAENRWQDVVSDVLSEQIAVPTTPFDFTLWFKSRVVMILEGRAWQYSRYLDPLTTKHQYGAQYFDLKLHGLDNQGNLIIATHEEWQALRPEVPCRCISFFTMQPCPDPRFGGPDVRHGFSLNVELLHYVDGTLDPTKFLPITIDPDIQNKGGNPGP